jgi:hypothetical protein
VSSPEQPKKAENEVEATEPVTDNTEGPPLIQSKEKELLTLDENLMEDLTPNTRRKVFREAFSMRINRNDEASGGKGETDAEKTKNSEIEKRHSFSGGEKVQRKGTLFLFLCVVCYLPAKDCYLMCIYCIVNMASCCYSSCRSHVCMYVI